MKKSTYRRLVIASALPVSLAAALVAIPAHADPHDDDCVQACGAQELREVSLDQLLPTQPAIGYDQVHYKLGRYGSDKDEADDDVNKRFDDWCEADGLDKADDVDDDSQLDDPDSFSCANDEGDESDADLAAMKTAVIGPGGKLYLTDGHHTFTSFWEAADGGSDVKIRVRITKDFSDLSTEEFWKQMQQNNWVWLFDENNAPITVDELPLQLSLAEFGDDRYRSLVYFTGEIGYGEVDDPTEYLEFYWAAWLRDRYDLDQQDHCDFTSYLKLIGDASRDMVALDDNDVVSDDKTAGELGKLDEWNAGDPADSGAYGDLSKPMSKTHPGKLAFALDHACSN